MRHNGIGWVATNPTAHLRSAQCSVDIAFSIFLEENLQTPRMGEVPTPLHPHSDTISKRGWYGRASYYTLTHEGEYTHSCWVCVSVCINSEISTLYYAYFVFSRTSVEYTNRRERIQMNKIATTWKPRDNERWFTLCMREKLYHFVCISRVYTKWTQFRCFNKRKGNMWKCKKEKRMPGQ